MYLVSYFCPSLPASLVCPNENGNRDNNPGRVFPYQLILTKNNSATNCLSQCQKFGFGAAGMEYGEECCTYPPNPIKFRVYLLMEATQIAVTL
jgi:hypothetical protein